MLSHDNGASKYYITLTIEGFAIAITIGYSGQKDWLSVGSEHYFMDSDLTSTSFYQQLEPALLQRIPDKIAAYKEFCNVLQTLCVILPRNNLKLHRI
jgi:hypothetical protein